VSAAAPAATYFDQLTGVAAWCAITITGAVMLWAWRVCGDLCSTGMSNNARGPAAVEHYNQRRYRRVGGACDARACCSVLGGRSVGPHDEQLRSVVTGSIVDGVHV